MNCFCYFQAKKQKQSVLQHVLEYKFVYLVSSLDGNRVQIDGVV